MPSAAFSITYFQIHWYMMLRPRTAKTYRGWLPVWLSSGLGDALLYNTDTLTTLDFFTTFFYMYCLQHIMTKTYNNVNIKQQQQQQQQQQQKKKKKKKKKQQQKTLQYSSRLQRQRILHDPTECDELTGPIQREWSSDSIHKCGLIRMTICFGPTRSQKKITVILPYAGITSQLAFYVNLHRAVIGPSVTLTGRWRPDIDLRRMLTGLFLVVEDIFRVAIISCLHCGYLFVRRSAIRWLSPSTCRGCSQSHCPWFFLPWLCYGRYHGDQLDRAVTKQTQ